jgi:chorismate mutase
MFRGVRGATTVDDDDAKQILAATRELLEEIVRQNNIDHGDIASVIFTMSSDLHAVFPAQAARAMGWTQVPLMCMTELEITGALPRCIRVLIHWNTEKTQNCIHHVYLRQSTSLRPDLVRDAK